jgi:hypothetical protein
MVDEKKETWLNYLAFMSVILAVCATLSTFKGSSFSTRTVLSQTQASDQWAFYQAKSVKGYIYEIQKEELELELKGLGSNSPTSLVQDHQRKIEDYTQKIGKYNEEKADIEKAARNFEATKIHSLEHGQSFGMAVIFLQIAILLSSIAALMKKKPVWLLGLATGAVGIVFFFNGLFLFYQ